MPKHRQTLFAVVREFETGTNFDLTDAVIIGVYLTFQRADEVKDAAKQEFVDRFGIVEASKFHFSIQAVTYYEE